MPEQQSTATSDIPESYDISDSQKLTIIHQKVVSDFFLHFLSLVLTVATLWLWVNQPVLANYNLALAPLIIAAYFLTQLLIGQKTKNFFFDILAFTATLLLLLSSTGGLASPLFFLIYFLLFASALLFETTITLTLTLSLVLFFANTLNSIHAALQLASLILIAPLAIWFGKQYLKLLETQKKIKILAKKSRELSASITSEETNALLWLSLNFKNSLLQIIHLSSELLADIGHLTQTQKEHLQSIHESAKEILKSGEKLKEKIDRETD